MISPIPPYAARKAIREAEARARQEVAARRATIRELNKVPGPFVERYGVRVCQMCNYPEGFCKGHGV